MKFFPRLVRTVFAVLCFHVTATRGQETAEASAASSEAPAQQADYFSEPGIIAGSVVDGELGGPIPGAMIRVVDTTYIAFSDTGGNFTIRDVTPGTYTVDVTQGRFQKLSIQGVNVEAGEVANLDLAMFTQSSEIEELEAFVVTFDDVQTGDMKLLGNRQKAISLSDAIGEESFSRLGLGDAGEAMSKVTGASVVDGKYVLIRGLGDRYSNTLLNGATVPSADPDRRSVQLDQFPSEVLESIVTSKSFTPDQQGSFSGGSVNMRTKSFPEQFFMKFGAGASLNTESTYNLVQDIPGGSRDWLAMDDGTRELPDLPATIPSEALASIRASQGDFGPAEELDRISNLFHNDVYFPRRTEARPGMDFKFSVGDQIFIDEDSSIGYVFSASYSQGVDAYDSGTSARFSQGATDVTSESFVDPKLAFSPNLDAYTFKDRFLDNPDVPPNQPVEFGITQTTWNTHWGVFAQVAYKPNSFNEFSLRFLHNQSADDRIKKGVGESIRSESGRLFEAYDFLYTERGISSLQAEGKHIFENANNLEVVWRASSGLSTQEQPDFRTLSYFVDFVSGDFAQAAGIGNNRFFRDLEDGNLDLGLDVTYPLSLFGREGSSFKAGLAYLDGEREYEEFAYRWSREVNSLESLQNWPNPVGIVDRFPSSVRFGNTISNITSTLSNYRAEKTVGGAYLMFELQLTEKLKAIGGARAEKSEFLTSPLDPEVRDFNSGEIDQTDWLPALSFIYNLGENSNLRFAYGRTLARPEYRELAAIRVLDPFNDEFYAGNPDLEITIIDNFDLRWEWFPRAGEIIAVSAFYKDMADPIEVALNPAIGAISPQNVEEGQVYGIEFEYRQDLDYFSDSLKYFSFGGNFSLIGSEISIPENELEIIRRFIPDAEDTRELIEQSPYILNLDFTFNNFDTGTVATLAYNIMGDRLSLVQSGPLPDVEDRSAPMLDIIFSQKFARDWQVKFTASNLLDSGREESFEDFNGNTFIYSSYKPGMSFGISFSYTLY